MVKLKIVVSISSIIFLLVGGDWKQNSYSKSDRFLSWKTNHTKLKISDFKMVPDFFREKYDAAISVTYEVKTDSNLKITQLELLVDRYESWFAGDDNLLEDSPLLVHELYHVLLYNYYIQIINNRLRKDSIIERNTVFDEFTSSPIAAAESFQSLYDNQSDHNRNRDFQRYWEYKIDSLNFSLGQQKGRTKELYSNISAIFPSKPEIIFAIGKDQLHYKAHVLEKYDLRLRVTTYFNNDFDTANYMEMLVARYKESGFIDILHQENNFKGYFGIYTECQDTASNRMFYDQIIRDTPYTYHLTFNHPLDVANDSLYVMMKERYFNSTIIEQDNSYWINFYNNLDTVLIPGVEKLSPITDDTESAIEYEKAGNGTIAYKYPFTYKGKLIIPFITTVHKTKKIADVVLILNDDIYFHQPYDSTSYTQLIVLDSLELREGKNHLNFGYTIKNDSTSGIVYMQNAVLDYTN